MSLPRYEKYKDSGVEWIGEIPEEWEVNKLKYAASIKYGLGQPPREKSDGLPIIRATNVFRGKIDSNNLVYVDPDDVPYERDPILKENDIIVVRSGAYTADSALITEEFEGAVAGYDMVVRCVIHSSKFVSYCLLSDYVLNKQLLLHSLRAAQPHLNREELSETQIVFPSLPEQTTIATFLDRKTAEIDQLIATKEKLIALYEEEKTAIINHAVTMGLDPQVKTKPSGVDWLGNIPEHWEVKRLKYYASKVGSGITPKGGASVYQLDGIPLLRSQNIHFSGLKMDDVACISQEVHDDMANSKVLPGDVLVNITGASIGRCYFADEKLGEANVNQHVCIVRPTALIRSRFLYYLLRSNVGQKQIDIEQTGSGREGLNFESLKNFILPVPACADQTAIVTHIETECSRLDAIIDKLKKQIELYKEYRTTLISEVVTGKIDVRGEVAA